MKLQNKYKIALVGYRLSGGGSDKVMVNLSLFLESVGVEVFVVTVIDKGNVAFGGTYFSTSNFRSNNRFFDVIYRAKALRNFFKQHPFDFIIDFRFRLKPIQELLISKFVYNVPTVYTVHSWATDHYIPQNKFLANLIYSKAKSIVCVSRAIENKLFGMYDFKELKTIHNPYIANEFPVFNFDLNSSDTILFVGQLNDQTKQLNHLFEAFSKSEKVKKKAKIKICGSGILLSDYKNLARKLGIQNSVEFLGHVQPPYFEMQKAKFLVVCSAFEGFPNVIVEALFCNLPVVSYDLQSGPNEVIIDKFNGLLVPNQQIDALSKAIELFFEDEVLYETCKSNARESVEEFSMENIGNHWLQLLNLK